MTKHAYRAGAATPASRIKTFAGLVIPSLDDIRDRAPLAPPVVAAWIVAAAGALSMRPLLHAATQQDAAAAAVIGFVFWASVVFAPVVFLAKAGLLAALAWAILELFDVSEVRFRQLVSIFLYGEAIVALRNVFGALYLHLAGGPDALEGGARVHVFGLSSFVSPDDPALFAATQSVSLAHLAWMAFVSLAVRKTISVRWSSAVAVATALWAVVVAVSALRATLLA